MFFNCNYFIYAKVETMGLYFQYIYRKTITIAHGFNRGIFLNFHKSECVFNCNYFIIPTVETVVYVLKLILVSTNRINFIKSKIRF